MSATTRVQAYLQSVDLRYGKLCSAVKVLGISHAGLGRKLKDEGSRYTDLLDAERKRRALVLLQANPGASIDEIAKAIGYQPGASITRAFQRWFGVSLREYRRMA